MFEVLLPEAGDVHLEIAHRLDSWHSQALRTRDHAGPHHGFVLDRIPRLQTSFRRVQQDGRTPFLLPATPRLAGASPELPLAEDRHSALRTTLRVSCRLA